MKQTSFVVQIAYLFLMLGTCATASCHSKQAVSDDEDTDSATDSGTVGHTDSDSDTYADTDADTDTSTDRDTDSDTDTGDDTASDDDTDSQSDTRVDSDTVVQAPLQITVVNTTEGTVFLSPLYPVTAQLETGGDPVYVNLKMPYCSVPCDEITDENASSCCRDCAAPEDILAILPEDAFLYTWSGSVYATDTDICDCGCHYTTRPVSGTYTISVNAYFSATCHEVTCEAPLESGVLEGADNSGQSQRFSATIDVPSNEDELVIEITRETKCDDGTTPACDMIPPTCAFGTEILAYQQNCYSCVNPDTCQSN